MSCWEKSLLCMGYERTDLFTDIVVHIYTYAFKNICLTLTNAGQEEELALLKLESSATEVMINICDQVAESNFSVDIFGLQA